MSSCPSSLIALLVFSIPLNSYLNRKVLSFSVLRSEIRDQNFELSKTLATNFKIQKIVYNSEHVRYASKCGISAPSLVVNGPFREDFNTY